MASSHGDLRHLLPTSYKRLISEWLEEDCPSFDYGGFVVGESEGEAKLLGKSVVCHPLTCPGSIFLTKVHDE
jgi:nicotinate-nucleotide pyrophosphorylase (carboxylating)